MKTDEKDTAAALRHMEKAFAVVERERDALKQQNEKLREYIGKLEIDMEEKDEDMRGLYVAACLKFGTMTGPLAMEMVLPLRNTERAIVRGYALTISDRVDRNERTVRVVKRGFGAC